MTIDDLTNLVPSPLMPVDTKPDRSIAYIEAELGTRLPSQLYTFCERYGTGQFGTCLTVLNPFSDDYKQTIKRVTGLYRRLKESEGNEYFPYTLYPDHDGLYPWALDTNGHTLWWLTNGNPEKWPIVAMTVDAMFEKIDMTMLDFLHSAFSANLDCILWDKDWLRENFIGIMFLPEDIK